MAANSSILSRESQREDSPTAPNLLEPRILKRSEASVRISQLVLLILILCYALQVFSPLRLNNDAIALLSMGESAAEGHGFLQHGQKTVFPQGYPALLEIMLKTGLGHSWAIIGLNVILLAAGLFAAYRLLVNELFKDKVLALQLCSLSLLSFVVIKHFTIALTDIAFLCCAMCCVALMSHASVVTWGRRYALAIAASWALMVGSIAVRRIGVALVPALLLAMASRPEIKTFLRNCSARAKAIAGTVILAGFVGTIWVVARTSTLSDFSKAANKYSWIGLAMKMVSYRLTELGELTMNLPLTKLPARLHGLIPFIGLVPLLFTIAGLLAIVRKRKHLGPTDAFMVSYMAILFVWPYYDARFWLPVIPLLIGYSDASIRQAIKFGMPKALAAVYISAFVILGIASIGYSTRITFAGSKFPDVYGDGTLRPTYCAAFQSCSDSFDKNKVDPESLHLLQIYR